MTSLSKEDYKEKLLDIYNGLEKPMECNFDFECCLKLYFIVSCLVLFRKSGELVVKKKIKQILKVFKNKKNTPTDVL